MDEPIEEKQLEGEALNNSMRDDSEAIDSTPDELKKEKNILINSGTEQIEIELPDGVKISLSSGHQSINDLCALSMWVLDELKKRKVNGNSNKGTYVG